MHFQHLTDLENGFGSQFNTTVYKVRGSNHRGATQARLPKSAALQHFVVRDQRGCKGASGCKFYMYRGLNFADKDGYELVMMAKHFPLSREIRIYTVNDISSAENPGLISSDMRIRKANSMRVEKLPQLGFDYENAHIARVCINDKLKGGQKSREFVIKNRYCLHCARYPFYFCHDEKKWLFQQELGTYSIVSPKPVSLFCSSFSSLLISLN